jgi:hypothetical protein
MSDRYVHSHCNCAGFLGEGTNMTWSTPKYEVVEVCAEATGYVYQD